MIQYNSLSEHSVSSRNNISRYSVSTCPTSCHPIGQAKVHSHPPISYQPPSRSITQSPIPRYSPFPSSPTWSPNHCYLPSPSLIDQTHPTSLIIQPLGSMQATIVNTKTSLNTCPHPPWTPSHSTMPLPFPNSTPTHSIQPELHLPARQPPKQPNHSPLLCSQTPAWLDSQGVWVNHSNLYPSTHDSQWSPYAHQISCCGFASGCDRIWIRIPHVHIHSTVLPPPIHCFPLTRVLVHTHLVMRVWFTWLHGAWSPPLPSTQIDTPPKLSKVSCEKPHLSTTECKQHMNMSRPPGNTQIIHFISPSELFT